MQTAEKHDAITVRADNRIQKELPYCSLAPTRWV